MFSDLISVDQLIVVDFRSSENLVISPNSKNLIVENLI